MKANMALCHLCGYTACFDNTSEPQHKQCPVCGEPCVSGDDGTGLDLAGRTSSSHIPRNGRQGSSPWSDKESNGKIAYGCLNPELKSLLQLLPQQDDLRRKERDVLRVAGALTLPVGDAGSGDDDLGDPGDAVYIRPRADPTMRVLKGRYSTQPRVRRAASMSALHRLAHPLVGHDSTEALAPQARKRRQETIQRILDTGRTTAEFNLEGNVDHVIPRTRSSAQLESNNRRPTTDHRGSITSTANRVPMTVSADSIHFHRRKSSAVLAGRSVNVPVGTYKHDRGSQHHEQFAPADAQQRRKPGKISKQSRTTVPLPGARANGAFRATANIRRKKVATMRSVNGWVREADPTSTRRHAPLKRRALALAVAGGAGSKAPHTNVDRERFRCFGGGGHNHLDGEDGTFLTALDTEGTPRATTIESRYNVLGVRDGDVAEQDKRGRRRSSDVHTLRLWNPRSGRNNVVSVKRGRCASTGASVGTGRRASISAKVGLGNAKARASPARGQAKAGPTRRAWEVPPSIARGRRHPAALSRESLRNSTVERERRRREHESTSCSVAESTTELKPSRMLERELENTAGGRGPNIRRRQSTTQSPDRSAAFQAKRVPTMLNERSTDVGIAPAWGAPESHPVNHSMMEDDSQSNGQADSPAAMQRPLNAWRQLREGCDPTSRSASVLLSFEDKVGRGVGKVGEENGEEKKEHEPTAVPSDYHPQTLVVDDRRQRVSIREISARSPGERRSHLHPKLRDRASSPEEEVWVPRSSLPSLLSDRPNSPLKPVTSGVSNALGGLSAATGTCSTYRANRRPIGVDLVGRMQRLDKGQVTVGDAWGSNTKKSRSRRNSRSSRNDSGNNNGNNNDSNDSSNGVDKHTGQATENPLSADGRVGETMCREAVAGVQTSGVAGAVSTREKSHAGSRRSLARGAIGGEELWGSLSTAVPQPLLYVGSADMFRLGPF